MHSNNIVLDHEHSHEHCAHGHDHTASDVNIEELDDELENITLVSSPHNVSTISSQLRMSNRLKVPFRSQSRVLNTFRESISTSNDSLYAFYSGG